MSITYEMSGASTNEIVVSDENKKEVINIFQVPSQSSLLVLEQKEQLLGQINPTVLFSNLSICADLFGVAYNAVNSMEGLQSAVWELRENMILAATDSANDYVNGFINHINKVPNYYNIAVKALLATEMNTEKSIKAFELITKEADAICKGTGELVDRFQSLINDAKAISKKITDTKAIDDKKKTELQENMASMQAMMDGLVVVQEDLDDEIGELTEEYKNLDKKIDKQVDQQFWLGITSTLSSAIGAGLNAYVSSTNAGMASKISSGLAQNSADKSQSSTVSNTQQSLTATKEKITALEKEITDLDTKLTSKTEELNNEKDSTKQETLKAEKQALADQLQLDKTNLAGLKAEEKSYTDVIAGIGAGLNNLGDKLDNQGNKIGSAIEAMTQRADSIAAKKSALRKEKREVLRKIAEYTKNVENSVVTANSLDLAIAALSAGIGAMGYIVSVLNDFYSFWTKVKSYCGNMASGEIESYFYLNEDDPEELKSIDFLSVIAENASKWVALKLVLVDYQNAFLNVYDKLQLQLKEDENSDKEVMWKRAITRSAGMSNIINSMAKGV